MERITDLLSRYPVVALLGARQVGKTTLAREIASRQVGPSEVFDLEDPVNVARCGTLTVTGKSSGLSIILSYLGKRRASIAVPDGRSWEHTMLWCIPG